MTLFDRVFGGNDAVYGLTEGAIDGAIAQYGEDKAVSFPNTAYSLPCYYAVTGTKVTTLKELKETPASVDVVTAQDIQERNVKSVPEALQQLPGVYMSQVAQGGIQIRGFESDNILILLDGMPMNTTYNNNMEWEMLPVENIERIEVVKGAGSSLYGGRAVGAVVNIITKDQTMAKGESKINAVLDYGSNNTWKKAVYANMQVDEKLSVGLGYENRKSDGFKGYYYTGNAKKGTANIKPDNIPPQLSTGKYLLGGRGEKQWENENISAHIKYDFDEDKSLNIAIKIHFLQ